MKGGIPSKEATSRKPTVGSHQLDEGHSQFSFPAPLAPATRLQRAGAFLTGGRGRRGGRAAGADRAGQGCQAAGGLGTERRFSGRSRPKWAEGLVGGSWGDEWVVSGWLAGKNMGVKRALQELLSWVASFRLHLKAQHSSRAPSKKESGGLCMHCVVSFCAFEV